MGNFERNKFCKKRKPSKDFKNKSGPKQLVQRLNKRLTALHLQHGGTFITEIKRAIKFSHNIIVKSSFRHQVKKTIRVYSKLALRTPLGRARLTKTSLFRK